MQDGNVKLLYEAPKSTICSNLLLEQDEKITGITFESISTNFNWTGSLAIEVLNNNAQIVDEGFDNFPGDYGEATVSFSSNNYVNEGTLNINLICSDWS